MSSTYNSTLMTQVRQYNHGFYYPQLLKNYTEQPHSTGWHDEPHH